MQDDADQRKRWIGPRQVATRLGISIKALRVYERAGLVTPDRRDSGWRTYGPAHIARLHSILALKAMGLSLRQIRDSVAATPIDIVKLLDTLGAHLEHEIDAMQIRKERISEARLLAATGDILSTDQLFAIARTSIEPETKDILMTPTTGSTPTRRLFLANDDSAGGALKNRFRASSRRAKGPSGRDRIVEIIDVRLVRDPVPDTDDYESFFAQRRALRADDPNQCGSWYSEPPAPWSNDFAGIAAGWRDLDRAEFWVDPDPNGQLTLLMFLHWIATQGFNTTKLHLVHGERNWGEIDMMDRWFVPPQGNPVGPDLLRLAQMAWSAFRALTPERWLSLLEEDLAPLPYLRRTVMMVLEELPDIDSGLAASEKQILSAIASGHLTPAAVHKLLARHEPRTLNYWEIGRLLDFFSQQPEPAILGLEGGPFDMAGQTDDSRRNRYFDSRLSLSEFGQALLEGRADLTKLGRISRWWGGTHLTNENCWRWDAGRRAVIPPA